jgi:hypothetical protein
MFVKLSQFIQSIQRVLYKPTTFTYRMHNINGKSLALQSVFLQETKELIDLQHPLFKEFTVRFIKQSPCEKYNEFFIVRKLEHLE